jgi:hypothetical protein
MMTHTVWPGPQQLSQWTRPCVYLCVYYILDVSPRIFPAFSPIGCGGAKNGAHSAFSKFLIGCKNCLGFSSLSPLLSAFFFTRLGHFYIESWRATCKILRAFLLEGLFRDQLRSITVLGMGARLVVLGVGRIRGRSLEMSAASHEVCHHVGVAIGAQDFVLPRQKAHRVLKY